MSRATSSTAALLVAALLAIGGPAAAQPAPGQNIPPATGADAPPQACLDMLDQLSKGIPNEETGPTLRSKGLRIRTPIVVSPQLSGELDSISGVRVRVMITGDGLVVPNSAKVQQYLGDRKLANAINTAVEQSLSFDTRAAFTKPQEFPFTTVYVACKR